MAYTTTPPTIDGQLSYGEWDDAAAYKIGIGTNSVTLYIMFDANRIYTAVDAIADTTQDTGNPSSGYITDYNNDYFLIAFDGDNDGVITYQNTNVAGNEVMGQDAFTRGGKCVDRGATTSGGTYRNAGWWNKDSSGNSYRFWSLNPPGPNQGAAEPFDYINTIFSGHRMYEHSIPFNGPGNELNLSRNKYVNISLAINDARSGSSALIGAIPTGGNGLDRFQQFMINSKPRAAIADTGDITFYTNTSINFDASPTKEPDVEALTYEWDFDYDGTTFNVDATAKTIGHSYPTKGSYKVAMRATDPHGARDIASTVVNIVEPASPPTIINPDPKPFEVTIDESGSVVFKADVNDVNLDEPSERLQLQWTVGPNIIKTENRTTAGATSYTFKSNYTGYNSAGRYVIKLRVNDTYNAYGKYTGGSMQVTRTWNLTVGNVNRPPAINTYLPATITVSTDEASSMVFAITKSDPDGDALKVKWLLDGSEVVTSRDSDTYTFNPKPPDYTLAGNHVVNVTVSDASMEAVMTWNLIVDDNDRPPTFLSVVPMSTTIEMDEGKSNEFSFTASDPDGDNLTYTWSVKGDILATGTGNEAFLLFKTAFLRSQGYDSSGSLYQLTLEVTDGKMAVTKEWSIKVNDVNRAPVSVIVSPTDGGKFPMTEKILFDATGTNDPDSDILIYKWTFGDGTTDFDPKTSHQYPDVGEYTVSLTVSDGKIEISKTIKIEIIFPVLKVDSITHDPLAPKEKETVAVKATIVNTGGMDIDEFQVSFYVDNEANKIGTVTVKGVKAGGSKEASLLWTAQSGSHRLIAKITPSNRYKVSGDGSKEISLSVSAGSTVPTVMGLSLPLFILLIVIMLLVVVLAVVAVSRRGRKRDEEAPAKPAKAAPVRREVKEAPPPPPPPPVPQPAISEQPPPGPVRMPEPLPVVAEVEPAQKAVVMCNSCGAKEAMDGDTLCDECKRLTEVPTPGPLVTEEVPVQTVTEAKPVTAKSDDLGVEEFDISEVFVVYEDGRLIDYATVTVENEVDKDIISGMLVAIQNFVKTTMSVKMLDSFEMGDKKAIMERGNYLILACMLHGTPPASLRERMQDIIQKLEGMYAGVIENWDGDKESFKGLRRELLPLFRLKSKMKIKEKTGDVQVKSAIEFYQGYIRLKVAVLNSLKTTITDASFKLDWNKDALKLARTEPEYPMDGSTVILGNVKPGEKKTVAYYLDPLICQESYLDGTLIYYDNLGKKQTADMKQRPADIVCPIFYTMETVNVAMLKRLLRDLSYSDSRVFEIESRPTLKAAYRMAREIVKGHDVREVREFLEKSPFDGETWFYGETKDSDEKIVIRVAAREKIGVLELFVASMNLASMTGLLAELGSEFKKRAKTQGIMNGIKPSLDEDIREQVERTILLLDKYSEAEASAGEIDQD